MDEFNPAGDSELFRAELRLFGEQPAQVDAEAADSVIARPGAQHFAGTAAEVEHAGSRRQAQHSAERGQFLLRKRVMDAMSAFGNRENTRDVQSGNSCLAPPLSGGS